MIRFISSIMVYIVIGIDYIPGCNSIYQYHSFAEIAVLKEHKIDRKVTTTKTKSHTRPSIQRSLTITSCLLWDTHSMLYYQKPHNRRFEEDYVLNTKFQIQYPRVPVNRMHISFQNQYFYGNTEISGNMNQGVTFSFSETRFVYCQTSTIVDDTNMINMSTERLSILREKMTIVVTTP